VMTMAGFSDADAAAVYRSFSSFLLGHLLLEVSSMGVETGPVEEPDMSEVEDLGGHPIVQRLEPHLSEDHAGEDFEEALEALLDRIGLLLPARRRGVSGEAAELTPNVRPSFVLIAVYTVNGWARQRLNDRPGPPTNGSAAVRITRATAPGRAPHGHPERCQTPVRHGRLRVGRLQAAGHRHPERGSRPGPAAQVRRHRAAAGRGAGPPRGGAAGARADHRRQHRRRHRGPDITESEHEVTLHAERPVVDTEAVPVKRVRLGKETVNDTEDVQGEVRKEQIEYERPKT